MSNNLLEWFPMFDCFRSALLKGAAKYYIVADCLSTYAAFRAAMHLKSDDCAYIGTADQLRYVHQGTIILLDGWFNHRADRNDIWFELKNLKSYCGFDGRGVRIIHEHEFIEKMN